MLFGAAGRSILGISRQSKGYENRITVVKPNFGAHADSANNPLSFDEAYAEVRANPNRTYHATGRA